VSRDRTRCQRNPPSVRGQSELSGKELMARYAKEPLSFLHDVFQVPIGT
jgi:hypothetical protein